MALAKFRLHKSLLSLSYIVAKLRFRSVASTPFEGGAFVNMLGKWQFARLRRKVSSNGGVGLYQNEVRKTIRIGTNIGDNLPIRYSIKREIKRGIFRYIRGRLHPAKGQKKGGEGLYTDEN